MNKLKQKFDIIRFTADDVVYYPSFVINKDYNLNIMNKYSKNVINLNDDFIKKIGIYSDLELEKIKAEILNIDLSDIAPKNQIPYTDIDIPLGQSRYGGPVFDLPLGIERPKNLRFAAQLDLSKFSPFDKSGLLPKTGQLIFFADIRHDTGKVIYANVPNHQLVRIIDEHEDNFYSGVLINQIFDDTETLEERFREPEDEDESSEANENGMVWGSFLGSEKSKIFGIYTHCQYSQKEIEDITFSNRVLLLQIGENGFNEEGVFSVTIAKEDLENLNFENCEFAWGQS